MHAISLLADASDVLFEPWRSGIMRRALGEAVLCGATSGVLGAFVLVRGVAFLGESVAHTVVLGAVVALILGLPAAVGVVVLAVLTALLTGALAGDPRFSADTATGILLPALFGGGIALIALAPRMRQSLDDVLFGSILAVGPDDLALALGVLVAVLTTLAVAGKELVLVAFDRPVAAALGYRVALLDAVLLVLVALAVAIGLRAVGSVLLAGLLLGPPVTARLLCTRFWPMAATAGGIGVACGLVGLYLTWYVDIGAGPAIVLTATAIFALVAAGRRVLRGRREPRVAPFA